MTYYLYLLFLIVRVVSPPEINNEFQIVIQNFHLMQKPQFDHAHVVLINRVNALGGFEDGGLQFTLGCTYDSPRSLVISVLLQQAQGDSRGGEVCIEFGDLRVFHYV